MSKKIVRQEIEYIPAKLKIIEFAQGIYKCEECGKEGSSKDTPTFVRSKVPNPLLTHSFVSPSLATEVIYQKYYLGVPLYRQEGMWDEKGLVLPRNMMANWVIKISEYYLQPLRDLMAKVMLKQNKLIHMDETTIQCNKEEGKKASTNSYMWVMTSGKDEETQATIFRYSSSRSGEKAKEYLAGFNGILTTDGYAGYNNIEGIIHAECWAHTRRYFYESIPLDENKKMNTNSYGYKGVEYCDKLFKIERECEELSKEEILKIRKEKSSKIVAEFFEWVKDLQEKNIFLNNKLKKALTYAKNQQVELSEFSNDARIPLSNNIVERAIRPFAVHRKNWLFADTVAGAEANAVMYSIIETAKRNKLNIYKYILYLLRELPQVEEIHNEEVLSKYLPWSKELPKDIKNYEEPYNELVIE